MGGGGVQQGEHAWWGFMCGGGGGACMVGGTHGRSCMRGGGGEDMHGRGYVWQWGRAWHTVNERAVRILLECILVVTGFVINKSSMCVSYQN